MDNNNQVQANPQLVIDYLTQEVASLTQENAVLKAILQETRQSTESKDITNAQQTEPKN